MTYAETLRKAIRESGLTLEEISRRCADLGVDVHHTYISKLRLGKRPAPSENVSRTLAQVLGIDAEELVMAAYLDQVPADWRNLVEMLLRGDLDSELKTAIPELKQYLHDNKELLESLLSEYQREQHVTFRNTDQLLAYHIEHLPLDVKLTIIALIPRDIENPLPTDASYAFQLFTALLHDTYQQKKIHQFLDGSVLKYEAKKPDITGASVQWHEAKSSMIPVPRLGSIRAGTPMEMIREVAPEYELVERDLIHDHDAFILRVQGDSMVGDRIYDGDRVVVIFTPDFTPSDICVVAIDGEQATLKRVKQQGDICILTPSNPDMEPMVFPAKDIHIIGVVVEVRHRLK